MSELHRSHESQERGFTPMVAREGRALPWSHSDLKKQLTYTNGAKFVFVTTTWAETRLKQRLEVDTPQRFVQW